MAAPATSLAPLQFPDGSASYTSPSGDQILASVNGPIEATRRETQKPEEATIEVFVKPGVGAGGVGERYVEGVLRGILTRVILTHERVMARRGIVVTLAVLKNKCTDGKVADRGGSYLPILPSLLNAALLALLSAAIPLSMTYTSTIIAVSTSNDLTPNPSPRNIDSASSVHVLAFSSKGHLLLNESKGSFDLDTWDRVFEFAKSVCRGEAAAKLDEGADVDMEAAADNSLEHFVRETVEDKLRRDLSWKIAAV
ncbi:hypothetical protein AJ80_00649 [Polytolypa hystricis UAMH7299]|uniref:Uncharacterized protein n=1 Tax=Polytolypa hystricis (strain UAMH7299) TaxID=1447883 RepID=A0A2B7Z137_POLH7|nr:hypothetical protein AJ80_00649 [Polytolypa hystricis UAMH7299]